MSEIPTLWPDDGRRRRARQLMEAAYAAAAELPLRSTPYLFLRELSEHASDEVGVWVLHRALGSVEPPADDLVREVEKGVAEYREGQPEDGAPRDHKFYIPMEMVLDRQRTKPTLFHVLGRRFYLRTKTSVEREFDRDLDEAFIPVPRRGRRTVPPTIVTCTAEVREGGRGWNEAISGPLEILRGLLELVTADRSERSHVETGPCATVPPPGRILWRTAVDADLPSAMELAVPDSPPAARPVLAQDHVDRIRAGAVPFTAPVADDSVADVAAHALQLYAGAMDAQFDSGCFLALWQCMEALALPRERGGRTTEITARANWILLRADGSATGFPKTLRSMARIRNGLVHTGRRRLVGPEDVNVLMRIVERLLTWYLDTAVHEHEKRYDLEARLLRVS